MSDIDYMTMCHSAGSCMSMDGGKPKRGQLNAALQEQSMCILDWGHSHSGRIPVMNHSCMES